MSKEDTMTNTTTAAVSRVTRASSFEVAWRSKASRASSPAANTVTLTESELMAMMAEAAQAAVAAAQATGQINMGRVGSATTTQKTMEEAIEGSISNRLVGWMGRSTKTVLVDRVAPTLGKIEVLAVPATLVAVAYTAEKTCGAASWLSRKAEELSRKSAAAAEARMPKD
jgi:hypothetical protein